MMRRPYFQRDQMRIGVLDGEIVAHTAVWPFLIRYGEAELSIGGIGGVCSHPDQRKKGYVAALMRDAIAYMQARGDHFSLLNTGEVNFYPKYGYQTLWSDGWLEIQAAAASQLNSSLKVRPATSDDLPQMAALFERQMAQRVTMSRSRETWQWRMAADFDQHRRVAEDGSGQAVAYLAGFYNNSQLEVVAESDEAVTALLADTGRIFLEKGPEKLSILLTPDEALLHRIRRMVACELITEYVRGANWMARIIHAEGLRAAVLPEMLRQAGLDERGLIFSIQADSVYLGLRGQDSTNIELDHGTFLQVLFGILPPAVLPLHPDAVQLLARLFPRRDFVIAPWDWF
jgi:predicted acetyltransferase